MVFAKKSKQQSRRAKDSREVFLGIFFAKNDSYRRIMENLERRSFVEISL